ncbi:hypothetical protein FGO68_gene8127 [Halteria grandinella]|uniref:Uncharacterized protein n=1 Tax=Halteria grandinella TaxID=5974 RepID=A0A8J8SW76_HALGN|nr:hypothetical protein FGO68_gene8127 [Halteria grandinella]
MTNLPWTVDILLAAFIFLVCYVLLPKVFSYLFFNDSMNQQQQNVLIDSKQVHFPQNTKQGVVVIVCPEFQRGIYVRELVMSILRQGKVASSL